MTISVIAGPTAADTTDSGCTTSAFTPADGDLLVAVTASLWGDAPTVADSLSGTWTQRAVSTGVTNTRIHTRPVVTGASMTVTVTPPYGGDTAVAIYRVSGHAASPIGANGGGNDSSANITPTIFTSTADNSYAFVGGVNTGNTTQSITSSDLTIGSILMGGTYTEYLAHGYKDCGTSGSESANLNAATAGPWYWCAVEILDGTTEHQATGALALTDTLAGGAIAEHPATGTLALTDILAGGAVVEHPATGALALTDALTGDVAAELGATGALALAVALTGDAVAGVGLTGALDLADVMTGSVTASLAATGGLPLVATLSGGAVAGVDITGGLALAATLAGGAVTEHYATGVLALTGTLTGEATDEDQATGALALTGTLTGAVTADLGATGSLALVATLTGGATVEHPATGTLALACAMGGLGVSGHFATGSGGATCGGTAGIVRSRRRTAYAHGQRRWSFRYELLDSGNAWIADLESVVSCTVSMDWLAGIKRKMKLELDEDGTVINWMSNRIRPWVRLHLPPYTDDDYVEWPLGVFLPSSPTRIAGDTGVVSRAVDGYDQLQVYTDDKVTTRYCVTAGTAYTDAVVTLLGNVEAIVDHSSSTLPADREWDPGTKKLSIINDLLDALNYESLSFDELGRAIVRPYVVPSQRASEYTYADDDDSLVIPKVDQELDLYGIANSWVLVVSNSDRPALSSSFVNNSESSPTSVVNRDRTIVDFRTEQDAADQAALDAKVARLAHEASQVFEHIAFSTGLNPLHSGNDVYRISYTPLGINSDFSETSWSMPLKVGAAMTHKARRVVTVSEGGGS